MSGEVYKLVLTAVAVMVIGSFVVIIDMVWLGWPYRKAGAFLLLAIASGVFLVAVIFWATTMRAG